MDDRLTRERWGLSILVDTLRSVDVHSNLGCSGFNPIKITDTFKIQKVVPQTLNLIV